MGHPVSTEYLNEYNQAQTRPFTHCMHCISKWSHQQHSSSPHPYFSIQTYFNINPQESWKDGGKQDADVCRYCERAAAVLPPSVSVTAVSGLSGLVRANVCFCDKLEFARIKTRLICMHNCTTPSFLPRSFRTRIETWTPNAAHTFTEKCSSYA